MVTGFDSGLVGVLERGYDGGASSVIFFWDLFRRFSFLVLGPLFTPPPPPASPQPGTMSYDTPSPNVRPFFFLARTRFLVHRELLAKNMPTFSGQCDYDRHMT